MSLTEDRNPRSIGIDMLPTAEILKIMHEEDRAAIDAVGRALSNIGQAVDDAVSAISSGGRVVYAGAGTSGRLGVLDASEVPPTFGSRAFEAVMAGGEGAVCRAAEGVEDDEEAGRTSAAGLRPGDMAVGISAGGRTPFVLAFLGEAKKRGARCWLLTCGDASKAPFLDGSIVLSTGPEVVAGSTRLKAATATKAALNMLSTTTMIRLGGVFDGLMVDVVPTNRKLIERAAGIVMEIAGCTRPEALEALEQSGMRPKAASLMKKKGISRPEAERLIGLSGGSLRKALSSDR